MTRWQKAAATCVIAAVVGGQILAVAQDREMWPFSNYPMYSRPQTQRIGVLHVQGSDGREWFNISDRYDSYIAPLKRSIVLTNLRRSLRRDNADKVLRAIARQYERSRREHRHDGPRLEAIRAVDRQWRRFDPSRPNDPPDANEVVAEVTLRR